MDFGYYACWARQKSACGCSGSYRPSDFPWIWNPKGIENQSISYVRSKNIREAWKRRGKQKVRCRRLCKSKQVKTKKKNGIFVSGSVCFSEVPMCCWTFRGLWILISAVFARRSFQRSNSSGDGSQLPSTSQKADAVESLRHQGLTVFV